MRWILGIWKAIPMYHAQQQIIEQMHISDNLQNIIKNRSQWKKIQKKDEKSMKQTKMRTCVTCLKGQTLFSLQTIWLPKQTNKKTCAKKIKHISVAWDQSGNIWQYSTARWLEKTASAKLIIWVLFITTNIIPHRNWVKHELLYTF